MAGLLFLNQNDERERLELPFVPTQTTVNRDPQYAEIAPPGMSGTFHQFTQGGTRRVSMDLLLNDVGRRSQDIIRGEYYLNEDLYTEVNNVRTALEWFDLLSNMRTDSNGVISPPAVLDVFIADYYLGAFFIARFNPIITLRHKRTVIPTVEMTEAYFGDVQGTPNLGSTASNAGDRYYIAGSAARATVSLELIAHNQIPNVRHPNMQW